VTWNPHPHAAKAVRGTCQLGRWPFEVWSADLGLDPGLPTLACVHSFCGWLASMASTLLLPSLCPSVAARAHAVDVPCLWADLRLRLHDGTCEVGQQQRVRSVCCVVQPGHLAGAGLCLSDRHAREHQQCMPQCGWAAAGRCVRGGNERHAHYPHSLPTPKDMCSYIEVCMQAHGACQCHQKQCNTLPGISTRCVRGSAITFACC
jgi:hypothetical protein